MTTIHTVRRGRMTETTTTTAVTHPTFTTVTSNARFYDGELTATYYWAHDGGTGYHSISRSDYEELIAAENARVANAERSAR